MSSNVISAASIQKLGHKIEEIRIRALLNIISKLDHGFIYDDDLSRSRELLVKLFEWFTFPSYCEQDKVLLLIYRVLKTNSGNVLISHISPTVIKSDLRQIRSCVQSKHYALVDEILQYVESFSTNTIDIPPLELESLTQSNRSEYNSLMSDIRSEVETTATPVEVYLSEKGSPHLYQSGNIATNEDENTYNVVRSKISNTHIIDNCLPYSVFPWQPLIYSDRHVLESIENSLCEKVDQSVILHTCRFFYDVLLQDFPAEVFLQRPAIVKLLHGLLGSHSKQISIAVVRCLQKLTKYLQVRISFYDDPSTHNHKQEKCTTVTFTTNSEISNPHSNEIENQNYFQSANNKSIDPLDIEDSVLLQLQQLSLPHYCIQTMFHALSYLGKKPSSLKNSFTKMHELENCNYLLSLSSELIQLISICIKPIIWQYQIEPIVHEIVQQMSMLLTKLGEVLEQARLTSLSNDLKPVHRVNYLHLLVLTKALLESVIPIESADIILPRPLKESLSICILDASFTKLYPHIHAVLYDYVKNFGGRLENDSLSQYEDVRGICESMTAAVKFIKHGATSTTSNIFHLALKSFPSLEFHKNLDYIKIFLELCVNKLINWKFDENILSDVEHVTVLLLSHSNIDIKMAMYATCHLYVIGVLGSEKNIKNHSGRPGECLKFLFRSTVFVEAICHGLCSKNAQIQRYAEEIILHILKGKYLVTSEVWSEVINALVPTMPLLHCYCDKTTPLGRYIVKILDPDIAQSLSLPSEEVIKGNLRLLFSEDSLSRNEAVTRLTWLLTTEEKSNEKLPLLKSLQGPLLNTVCLLENHIDLSVPKSSRDFYQVSSLVHVLDLLSSSGVDPTIRKSALSQVGVMMEDKLLHKIFLEQDGINLVMDIFRNSLMEREYHNYPDNAIPVISILKNICLNNPIVRQELSMKSEIYYLILRSLFLFGGDELVRADASQLLALLLFSEYIVTVPNTAGYQLSIVYLIADRFRLPFKCKTHWRTSKHTKPALTSILMSNKTTSSTLRLHWNIEWYSNEGGINHILKMNQTPSGLTDSDEFLEFSGDLRLTKSDLASLKYSSALFCCDRYLQDIQNASIHQSVIESTYGLTSYLMLQKFSQSKQTSIESVLINLPWETSLSRFLLSSPSSQADAELLTSILSFLMVFLEVFKSKENHQWVKQILKNMNSGVIKLLQVPDDNTDISLNLNRELLMVITKCSSLEQPLIDLGSQNIKKISMIKTDTWTSVIEAICECLRFNDGQHFYNLAHLDYLLCCLAQISSTFNWGNKKLMTELTDRLTEIVEAFHCGKGTSASISHMGLSVTRNAVLTMNHMLCEMQQSSEKNWEQYWLRATEKSSILGNSLNWLSSLWSSRDLVLRSATFQLLGGFSVSRKGAASVVSGLRSSFDRGIWTLSLSTIIDHEEASIVREQAAILLTNLISHFSTSSDGNILPLCLGPILPNEKSISATDAIFLLLEEYNFYVQLNVLLSCIFFDCTFNLYKSNELKTWNSNQRQDEFYSSCSKRLQTYRSVCSISSGSSNVTETQPQIVITPGLVKALAWFISNLISLDSKSMLEELNRHDLIRSFFRCITMNTIEITNNRSLVFSMELLEMNAAICCLLRKAVERSIESHSTVLRLKDCLAILLSLLDPALYHDQVPSILYLRNRLWSEIFMLITSLLTSDNVSNEDSNRSYLSIISTLEECGHKGYLQALCESVNGASFELQNTALSSLTSLLSLEITQSRSKTQLYNDTKHLESTSIQNVLDTVRSSHTYTIPNDELSDIENVEPTRLDLIFYNNLNIESSRSKSTTQNRSDLDVTNDTDESEIGQNIVGGEICHIIIRLYNIHGLKSNYTEGKVVVTKEKEVIVGALKSLLCVSREAKRIALENGFLETVIIQLRQLHVRLSLESADCLKRALDKKRVCPILNEITSLLQLLMNFMNDDDNVKSKAVTLGLADLVHKLWSWMSLQLNLLAEALRMLCTFTTNCQQACQSIPLTSEVAGVGPRKTPSNLSLLHAVIYRISREMELVSRTHDLDIMSLSLHLLHNCCQSQECRILISKSNLFQSLARLHPAITRRQKPWDSVEVFWLEFLEEFTSYTEGQIAVVKSNDALDLIVSLTSSSRNKSKVSSLKVLRNITFCQSNRPRLLGSGEFLQVLNMKLSNGNTEEKAMCVVMIWALIANSQKSKLLIKSAGFEKKLQDLYKEWKLSDNPEDRSKENINNLKYVLQMINENR